MIVTQILTNRVTAADQKRVAEFAAEYIADAKKNATSDDAFRRQLKAMGIIGRISTLPSRTTG